jgi:transposase
MKEVEALVAGLAGCPGCTARDQKIAALEAELARLKARLAKLEELVRRNSRNSHTPPSADPDKPAAPPEKKPSGRRRGGQPNHEGTTRELLPTEQVDKVVVHRPEACECCHAALPEEPDENDPQPTRHQVWELRDKPCEVTEHQGHARTCLECGHVTRAEIPAEVAGSCVGPKLAATATLLTGGFQISRRQVGEVFEDVLNVPVSLGTISNLEKETSAALEGVHQEAAAHVRQAGAKNLDETSWKKKGKKCWLWVCATVSVVLFVIHPSRGKQGLKALMGRVLKGIFSSDRWHIYGARACRARQVCWAHLQRDFQKLVERGGESKRIGEKAKDLADNLFLIWKDYRAGDIDRETLAKCLHPIQREFEALMREGTSVAYSATATFCQNLLDLRPALWTFIRVEGVEPTNNHAERVLRRAVIWRKRSFGADSEDGCRFVERVLTAVVSRRLQRLPVLAFLEAAIRAHRSGQPAPSLLPQ